MVEYIVAIDVTRVRFPADASTLPLESLTSVGQQSPADPAHATPLEGRNNDSQQGWSTNEDPEEARQTQLQLQRHSQENRPP